MANSPDAQTYYSIYQDLILGICAELDKGSFRISCFSQENQTRILRIILSRYTRTLVSKIDVDVAVRVNIVPDHTQEWVLEEDFTRTPFPCESLENGVAASIFTLCVAKNIYKMFVRQELVSDGDVTPGARALLKLYYDALPTMRVILPKLDLDDLVSALTYQEGWKFLAIKVNKAWASCVSGTAIAAHELNIQDKFVRARILINQGLFDFRFTQDAYIPTLQMMSSLFSSDTKTKVDKVIDNVNETTATFTKLAASIQVQVEQLPAITKKANEAIDGVTSTMDTLSKFFNYLKTFAPVALAIGTVVVAYVHYFWPSITTRVLLATGATLCSTYVGLQIWEKFPLLSSILRGKPQGGYAQPFDEDQQTLYEETLFPRETHVPNPDNIVVNSVGATEFAAAIVAVVAVFGITLHPVDIVKKLSALGAVKRGVDVIVEFVMSLIMLGAPTIKEYTGFDIAGTLYPDSGFEGFMQEAQEVLHQATLGNLPVAAHKYDKLLKLLVAGHGLSVELPKIGKAPLNAYLRPIMVELAKLKEEVDTKKKHNMKLPAEPILITFMGPASGTGKSTMSGALVEGLKVYCCKDDPSKLDDWEANPSSYVHTRSGDKFHDGMKAQTEIIRYNDAFTDTSVPGMESSDAKELIKFINVEDPSLRFSSVDEKGSTGIRPKFVLATTNTVSFRNQQAITNASALVRRMEDGVPVFFKPLKAKTSEWNPKNLAMFLAKKTESGLDFECSSEELTYNDIFMLATSKYDDSLRRATSNAIQFLAVAKAAQEAYLAHKSGPSVDSVLASLKPRLNVQADGADSDNVSFTTAEETGLMVIEDTNNLHDGDLESAHNWNSYRVFRHRINTRNETFIDRMDTHVQTFLAFDKMTEIPDLPIIEASRLRSFGTFNPEKYLVRGYDRTTPALFKVRGFRMVTRKNHDVSFSPLKMVTDSMLQELPSLCAQVFRDHNFCVGGIWFSPEEAFDIEFFVRIAFCKERDFTGLIFRGTQMTSIFGIMHTKTTSCRAGLHTYHLGMAARELFTSLGYDATSYQVPFISWRIEHAHALGSEEGSVAYDTFAIFTWVLDSIIECGLRPEFVYNYAKSKIPELQDMGHRAVIAMALAFDTTKMYIVPKIEFTINQIKQNLQVLKDGITNKLASAGRAIVEFVKQHKYLIALAAGVVATTIATFYGIASMEDADIQSGPGTKTFIRRGPKTPTKKGVRSPMVRVQIGSEKVLSLTNIFRPNTYALKVRLPNDSEGNKTWQTLGRVVFLRGRRAMTNKHITLALNTRARASETLYPDEDNVKITNENGDFNFALSTLILHVAQDSDVSIITFPKNFREHKDISKHFLIQGKHNQLKATSGFKSRLMNEVTYEDATSTIAGTNLTFKDANREDLTLHNWYGYNIKTKDGDCGSLLVSNDGTTSGQILGIHVAGDNRAYGYGLMVTLEDISFMLGDEEQELHDHIEQEVIDLERGELAAQSSLQYSPSVHCGTVLTWNCPLPSGVHSSSVKERFRPGGDLPKEYTTDVVDCHPKWYGNARQGYGPRQATIDGDMMLAIGSHIGDRYSRMSTLGNRILSVREGIEGVQGSALRSVDSKTSPGYPFTSNGRKRTDFIKFSEDGSMVKGKYFDPLLMPRIGIIDTAIRKGGRPFLPFMDALKDERRKLAKVESHSTRLVSGAPFDLSIIFRMYFGSFMETVQANPLRSNTVIGLNPYSAEWDLAAREMLVKTHNQARCGAGDFKGWDQGLNPKIGMALRGAVRKFYEGAPDEENLARETLLDMCFESVHIRGSVVEEWVTIVDGVRTGFSWPSGNGLTAPGNSVMNVAGYVYHFLKFYDMDKTMIPHFFDMVVLYVIGDDNVYAVPELLAEHFLETNVAGSMLELGMVLTSDTKGEINTKLRPLEEVSLIKRHWRLEPLIGKYVAPLDIDVVIEQCMWTQRTSHLGTATSNLNATVNELSLHGQEVFDEWIPKLRTYYGKDFNVKSTDWEIVFATVLKSEQHHL